MGDDPLKRQRHLDDYRDKEGIELDPEKIEKNPGLRTLAKMMLNSMWGKFGQRTNKTQVREFDDSQKFSTFCNSDTLQIKYVGIQSDDRVEVQYTLQEEDESILPNLNIFVACFTICWARLKLYDALNILQERVLYKDTDSVVFLSAQGMPEPPLGDYLGDFKDELPPEWNLPPEVQKTTGTRPTKVKRTIKSEASHSIDWGRDMSILKSSKTMC